MVNNGSQSLQGDKELKPGIISTLEAVEIILPHKIIMKMILDNSSVV